MASFKWTEQTEKAAHLIAAGNLTYPQIADAVDSTRNTIYLWRQNEEFKARVDQYLEELREDIKRIGIADQLKRVAALNDRWGRMRRIIEERADDPTMQNVAGGKTGLMVRTVKRVSVETDAESGETRTDVEEFAVDTALLKELRDHEKQAAQELGQWAEKQQISGPDGAPLVVLKLGNTASTDDL